jgi:perosamine synthetase
MTQMSLPDMHEDDVRVVAEVVRSGRLALGPWLGEFEKRVADYVGVGHAVAVSSGTAALHLLVRALGIGPGDEVLVPSFTFVASVNPILYERAVPVFVDIEPETYNLSPAYLESKITPRTKAIMAVDVFGHPAEWDEIQRLAGSHGLKIIDDSCEALGAEYRGRKLGSFGDAAAFAFYPNKQMTTGEGGILVTDDDEIARVARSMASSTNGSATTTAWTR